MWPVFQPLNVRVYPCGRCLLALQHLDECDVHPTPPSTSSFDWFHRCRPMTTSWLMSRSTELCFLKPLDEAAQFVASIPS